MTDKRDTVWNVLRSRDAVLVRMQEAMRKQSVELVEKEEQIRAIHKALQEAQSRESELASRVEKLNTKMHDEWRESWPRARPRNRDESSMKGLQRAVRDLEMQQRQLAQDLQERDRVIHTLRTAVESPEEALRTARELERKEGVIRELSDAVDAYRLAFSIFGFVVRPINWLLWPVRYAARQSLAFAGPRLGNLNQHAPRELKLPPPPRVALTAEQAPRISIVTPSFRQAAYIERTIRSVLEQGYPNLEYVVQDGGSDDGTRQILERYAGRLSSWESRADKGQAEAINRGFARTTGDIMAWLNSDDILFPGALACVADYFVRHPDVDVVYGHRILIDEHDRQIGRWLLPSHDDNVLSWADYVPQETLFWRRRIWDKVGGKVDESFRFALDWDLLIRFREAGARFARLPRFLGGFRIHAAQKTSAAISDIGFEEMDRIRARVLGRVPSRTEVQKAVMPYLLRHAALDLGWRVREAFGASP